MKKSFPLIILFSSLLILSLLFPNTYSQEPLMDEWMEMFFLGTKLGNIHVSTIKTIYNGKPAFMTESVESTFGLRGDTDFTTEVSTIEYEDENMRPLFIILNMNISKARTMMTCDFSPDKKINIKVSTPESSFEKELDKSNDVFLSFGLSKMMLSKGFKPGTSYAYKMLFPEKFDFLLIKTKVIGKESVDVNGKTMNLNKLQTDIEEMKLTKFDYIDDEGVCYISEIPLVGMKFIKVDKKDISEKSKSAPFELTDLLIKPTGKLEHFSKVFESKKGKLTITSKDLDLRDFLLSNQRQVVKFKDPKNASFIVHSTKDKEQKIILERPFDKAEFLKSFKEDSKEYSDFLKFDFEKYLTDSPFIQSKNEKIGKKALEIVGKEDDINECSKLLCQ